MYPASFEYYRAGSVAEVSTLLRQHPGAKLLAGGHSLIPLLKLRLAAPPAVIDIGRIAELRGVTATDGTLRIGALTTHAELAASGVVREHAPALAEAAGQIGDPAVRNRGTIGGNVAHADPASDLPTVLMALGARFVYANGSGSHAVPADRFFTGFLSTALGDADLLTTIEVPVQAAHQGSAYVKFEHPASRYAVIGVAALLTAGSGKCSVASVVLGGLVDHARRAAHVERALVGQPLTADAIGQAAARVDDDLDGDLMGDVYASGGYRKGVAPVWVRRALTLAASRIR